MNIVIVEDDINMRKSLEIALGEYDELKIKSYKSAVEALKKMGDDVDLIITDINKIYSKVFLSGYLQCLYLTKFHIPPILSANFPVLHF